MKTNKMKFRKTFSLLGVVSILSGTVATVACGAADTQETKKVDGKDVVFSYQLGDGTLVDVTADQIWGEIVSGHAQEFNSSLYKQLMDVIAVNFFKNYPGKSNFYNSYVTQADNEIKNLEDQCKSQYGSNWQQQLQTQYYDPVGGKDNYITQKIFGYLQSSLTSELSTSNYIYVPGSSKWGNFSLAQQELLKLYIQNSKPVYSKQVAFKYDDGSQTTNKGDYWTPYFSNQGPAQGRSTLDSIAQLNTLIKSSSTLDLSGTNAQSISDTGSIAAKDLFSIDSINDSRFSYALYGEAIDNSTNTTNTFRSLDTTATADDFSNNVNLNKAFASSKKDGVWVSGDNTGTTESDKLIADIGGGWKKNPTGKSTDATTASGNSFLNWDNTQAKPTGSTAVQTIFREGKQGSNIYFVRAKDGIYFSQMDTSLFNTTTTASSTAYATALTNRYRTGISSGSQTPDFDLASKVGSFFSTLGFEQSFYEMWSAVQNVTTDGSINSGTKIDIDGTGTTGTTAVTPTQDNDPIDSYLAKIQISDKYKKFLDAVTDVKVKGMIQSTDENFFSTIEKDNNDTSGKYYYEYLPLGTLSPSDTNSYMNRLSNLFKNLEK